MIFVIIKLIKANHYMTYIYIWMIDIESVGGGVSGRTSGGGGPSPPPTLQSHLPLAVFFLQHLYVAPPPHEHSGSAPGGSSKVVDAV